MIPLSFSAMSDYQCPFRFRVLRIDKTYREPETQMLRIGSAVAEILAAYRRHCYAEGLPSDLSFFENAEVNLDPDIKDRVADLLMNFASTEFATVPLEPKWVFVESQPISRWEKIGGFAYDANLAFLGHVKQAWLHPEVAFRLKSDFCYILGDTLHIIDDKTGYGDGDEQQLAIYAYLILNTITNRNGLSKIVCAFNNIAKRTVTQVEFSPEDVEPMRQVLLDAMREINERTEWPAIACSKCSYCTVPGCPIREDASKALTAAPGSPVISIPSSITTREEAEKALIFVEFADGISKQVKELLSAYVAQNGPVCAGGKVARYQDKETWKPKDLSALCAALIQFGAPKELVWKNLSLTRAALERIVKKGKLESKMPWIEAYVEKKPGKAFGIVNDKTF